MSDSLCEVGCCIHGEAFTHGCPGCTAYAVDRVVAAQMRERKASDTGVRISLDDTIRDLFHDRQSWWWMARKFGLRRTWRYWRAGQRRGWIRDASTTSDRAAVAPESEA